MTASEACEIGAPRPGKARNAMHSAGLLCIVGEFRIILTIRYRCVSAGFKYYSRPLLSLYLLMTVFGFRATRPSKPAVNYSICHP
jgi:hypothetical protein